MTPGKAAVADSDNSSMTAVYQAVEGAVGTLGVGNQDTVEGVAGVEVENPHHYADAAAVVDAAVDAAVVVVVGHSSHHIGCHAVAEPTV